MTNLLKIKDLLIELNSSEFENLQKLIEDQSSQNKKNFENSIYSGDVINIEKYIKKISFDDIYLKSIKNRIVPHIKSLHYLSTLDLGYTKFVPIDEESNKIFYILFNEIFDLGETFQNFKERQKTENFIIPTSDILFSNLFCRLKLNFEYYIHDITEPYPKYLFLKACLKNHPDFFKGIVDNFTQNCLSKIDYQENSLLINDLIKSGYTETLFQQAKSEENYNYLKTIIPIHTICSKEFMIKGLLSYHFPIVKENFEHGIPFFEDQDSLSSNDKSIYKNALSIVFSSKESFLIQEYIINNISNISIGNHIIIKTLLHKLEDSYESDVDRNTQRMELVQKIMYKYSDLDEYNILSLNTLLEKRKDSLAKNLLIKFFQFDSLNKKFKFKSHENENNFKNKI